MSRSSESSSQCPHHSGSCKSCHSSPGLIGSTWSETACTVALFCRCLASPTLLKVRWQLQGKSRNEFVRVLFLSWSWYLKSSWIRCIERRNRGVYEWISAGSFLSGFLFPPSYSPLEDSDGKDLGCYWKSPLIDGLLFIKSWRGPASDLSRSSFFPHLKVLNCFWDSNLLGHDSIVRLFFSLNKKFNGIRQGPVFSHCGPERRALLASWYSLLFSVSCFEKGPEFWSLCFSKSPWQSVECKVAWDGDSWCFQSWCFWEIFPLSFLTTACYVRFEYCCSDPLSWLQTCQWFIYSPSFYRSFGSRPFFFEIYDRPFFFTSYRLCTTFYRLYSSQNDVSCQSYLQKQFDFILRRNEIVALFLKSGSSVLFHNFSLALFPHPFLLQQLQLVHMLSFSVFPELQVKSFSFDQCAFYNWASFLVGSFGARVFGLISNTATILPSFVSSNTSFRSTCLDSDHC